MVAVTANTIWEFLGHQVFMASFVGQRRLMSCRGIRRIDFVITDHAMPHMTGSQLADRIRGIRRTCQSSSRLAMPSFRAPKSRTAAA